MNKITQKNLKNTTTWKRILLMLLFVFIYSIAEVVLTGVVIGQTLFILITGNKNTPLALFGKQLANYIYAILLFLTFDTEKMPFPFVSWPNNSTNNSSQ